MKKILLVGLCLFLCLATAGYADLQTNLVSYYKFDTGADDAHGSNDGTVDGATLTTGDGGIINEAYSFDGNAKINIPNIINGDTSYTISAWIKTTSTSTQYIFTQRDGGDDTISLVMVDGYVRGITNSNDVDVSTTTQLNDGEWHYVVFNGGSGGGHIYVDGKFNNSDTDTSGTYILDNHHSSIGYDRKDIDDYWDGKIDEVGIYSRALSELEISELYNSGAGYQYPFSFSISSNQDNYDVYMQQGATEHNFSTTDGTVDTGLDPEGIWNITIDADDSVWNNTYTNYNISESLTSNFPVLNISAYDLINSSNQIDDFNVTINTSGISQSLTTTVGQINATAAIDTYTLTLQASGYAEYENTKTITTLSNETKRDVTFYLYNSSDYTINIYDEKDGTNFDTSGPDEIKLTVYCQEDTLEYNITGYTQNITITCPWEFWKLDMIYPSSSYFRTLQPKLNSHEVNWYMIDTTEETALQIFLDMNDLTGEYSDGKVTLKKPVNESEETIIEQLFDIEDKITLYLIQNNLYTLQIYNSEGDSRTLGWFLADSAGTKTINIPDISFIPDEVYGNTLFWDWSQNQSPIKLTWQDTEAETNYVTLNIYDENYSSIYSTTTDNSSESVLIYSGNLNTSYIACLNASHSIEGQIESCKTYVGSIIPGNETITDWPGMTDNEQKLTTNTMFILLSIVILLGISQASIPAALFIEAILFLIFRLLKWVQLGNAYTDYAIVTVICIIAGFWLYLEANKKK
ncbi:MAG: LamG domain-containing protein [Petrotogales bacterium]